MHLLSFTLVSANKLEIGGLQMHLHDINTLLNLQGVTVKNISEPIDHTVYVTLEPIDSHQPCPSCGSVHTIRRGSSKSRHVRHLDIWENHTLLILPTIRLSCKWCGLNFTWSYSFVEPKSRYTNAFKEKLAKSLDGGTVKHSITLLKVPYTSGERFIKQVLFSLIPLLQEQVHTQAQNCQKLVIGIDDFAIRKGHTYNTGIHDLRTGSLLSVVKGRKCEELLKDESLTQLVRSLSPFAVVMDLAKSYHNFAKEVFPNAIRIADRFHVNRYITDALHAIRKRISKTLPIRQTKELKKNKNFLERRNDSLNEKERLLLETLLKCSTELAQAYWFKEKLIEWYDYSNKRNALSLLEKWIEFGEHLNIPEIIEALKPFKNWKIEIANYHLCRFTNASVEGRNNKIKALQRRSYFLRNRQIYEYRIYLECNSELLTA